MNVVTDRVLSMKRSGIRAIANLANVMPGEVVHLEIGQPHFPTPRHIVDAAVKAMEGGYIRYTKNEGIPEVRAKIGEKISRDFPGWNVAEENVLLTIGGVYGLAITMAALLNPGDKVMIPDPGWPNYTMEAITTNGVPLYYPLRQENGFKPSVRDLEQVVTPDTKIIIVNNPSNPIGTVMTESECREVLDFAYKHNLTVLSDEVYDRIVYDVPFTPMASLNHPATVVTANSFSKTYAMTGWRLGFLIASEQLCANLVKMSEAFISCPPYISQKAAEAAICGPQDFVHAMAAYYRKNRDLAVEMLDRSGLPHSVPQGAFYMLIDISRFKVDSETFAKRLLAEKRVAVAPGCTFGPSSDGYIRISFCTEIAQLEKGLSNILSFVNENAGR